MNDNSLDDFFRWFILCQAGFVFLASALVFVRYGWMLKRTSKQSLPWHVALISLSYMAATGFIGREIYERFGTQTTWRTPAAAFVFICGDLALCFLLTHIYSHRTYADKIRRQYTDEMVQKEHPESRALRHITESSETPRERGDRHIKENL
jgi:hypothetical protein